LRLICWVISWVVLLWFDVCWCYGVVRLGWCGILMQAEAHTSNQSNTTHEITQQISRKLLRMDVPTFETCWRLNNEIIKQVTSSWSIFNYQGDARSNKHKIKLRCQCYLESLVYASCLFSVGLYSCIVPVLTVVSVCWCLQRMMPCCLNFCCVESCANIS